MPTAVITGASRGLGRALAVELAGRGWDLILDARGEDDLEKAVSELPGSAGVTAVPGDISDGEHRRRLAESAQGGVDVIVNNAGTLGPSPLPALIDLDPDDLDAVLHVNVTSQLAVIQELMPHLAAGGLIVNITSDAGVEAYPGWGAYGASKAALEQVSAVLAAENPHLTVIAFDPGDIRTRMHQEAFPGEDISDRPPPEEVAPSLADIVESPPPSGRVTISELRARP